METDEILVNQLFAGSYLDEGTNIGHEVINLFKADDGKNYLYITPSGTIDTSVHPVKSVLFVRNVKGKTTVEVVAKAEGLVSASEIDILPENIKYAGASIAQIFSNNVYHDKTDPGISFTFRAEKVRTPKSGKRIILTIDKDFNVDDDSVYLIRLHSNSRAISNQSTRKYYSLQEDDDAYCELRDLLNSDKYWEPDDTTQKLVADDSIRRTNPTFLEIIRKDNDELIFSNLLDYYFQYNRAVFRKFAKEVLGVADFALQFDTIRESENNIDLLIKDDRHVLVIENKIKSGLNGLEGDNYSQLNKYQNHIEEKICGPEDELYEKESRYYIFTPDYNHIDASKYELKKPYKIIKYSTIYKFFCDNAVSFMDEKYFPDFLKGLKNHAVSSMSERNFSTMRSRFLEKINRV